MRTTTFFAIALTSAGLAFAACNNEPAARPTCDEIAEACHPSTDPEGIECHELAEDPATTDATCAAKKADCLAVCEVGGMGGGGMGGGGAGGTGGAGGAAGGGQGGTGG